MFQNKTVLITGHTGFKGSWLATWLANAGAKIIGLSDRVPTTPSHYELIKKCIQDDHRIDIKNSKNVVSLIKESKPDFIFHLAAQPIVLESYDDPLNTFMTNAIGTANILDGLRQSNHQCVAVMITSDKCYDNVEWTYGYREIDRLGGKDPYSGSKGASELIIRSYVESFFKKNNSKVCVAVGRAGNVIGGGDWAPYRIIPDCIRSWSKNEKPEIRSPYSTRPWQYVLEPLSGYITLAEMLYANSELNGQTFNFGPPADQNHTVAELVNEITSKWPGSDWVDKSLENKTPNEAGLLKLNCDKALHELKWKSRLNFKETAEWTSEWYRSYYEKGKNSALEITYKHIEEYSIRSKNKLII